MKLSRSARRNAAAVAATPERRRTYCRHWALTRLACNIRGSCPNPQICPDYEDAAALEDRPRLGKSTA